MATELTSVVCNHCGAPLEVPDSTRFLTCSYCGTRLEIHRTGNAVYTEILSSIDQRTQRMAQDIEQIKRQNEVERLDREWQMQRDSLLTRDKDGSVSPPSAIGGVLAAMLAIVFGIFWTGIAPGPMKLFGLLFIVAAIAGAIGSVGKAARYRDAEDSYRRQRQSLTSSDRTQE